MAPSDPNHVAYCKGNSLWKLGRFKEASQFFQSAVEERPEDYQALWALGNCYAELKKPRKAEQAFRRAIACCTNSDRTALLFNLANALFDQKHYAFAIAIYSEIPSGHELSSKARRNALLAESRRTES